MDVNYVSEDSENSWPERPFLTIWYQPRKTIRAIVDADPIKHVHVLAMLTGITLMLDNFVENLSGSILMNLAFLLIGGPIIGIGLLYLFAAIFSTSSAFVRGSGKPEETRTALAWASIPQITLTPVYLIYFLLLFFEEEFSSSMFTFLDASYSFLIILVGLWGFIVFLLCLAEVNRISFWKAVLVFILPFLVAIILGNICGVIFLIMERF